MARDEDGSEKRIYHRTIDPDGEVNIDLVELVADVEGCEVQELPTFWTRVDGIVEDVFSDPPAPEAQVRLQFSYAGYRIDVDQSGEVELMKVADVPAAEE